MNEYKIVIKMDKAYCKICDRLIKKSNLSRHNFSKMHKVLHNAIMLRTNCK